MMNSAGMVAAGFIAVLVFIGFYLARREQDPDEEIKQNRIDTMKRRVK